MKVSITKSKKDNISSSVSTLLYNTDTCKSNSSTVCDTQVSQLLNQVLKEQPVTGTSVVDSVTVDHNQIIMATANRVWVYSPDSGNHNNFLPQTSTSNSNTGSIEVTKKHTWLYRFVWAISKQIIKKDRSFSDLAEINSGNSDMIQLSD